MEYSIVIPVHNEAEHIGPFVEVFLGELPASVSELLREVILVENGSTDASLAACEALAQGHPGLVKVVRLPRGSYGEAIKAGMLAASGTHLSILECDFLDADFVAASVVRFEHGARFMVASKRHPKSVDQRPWKRRFLTHAFNLFFLRICLGYPGTDTHGLKSIETSLAKSLCEKAVTTDEIFQTEIVLIAWKLGVTVEELPIQIREKRAAPVAVLRRLPRVIHIVKELRASLVRF